MQPGLIEAHPGAALRHAAPLVAKLTLFRD
jgi:hypothetical protein